MADSSPTVEIAIPYFGSVELLKTAVLSVLAQSDERWRLLVVADGPDVPPVEDWLATLADPRLRWHRNTVNQGVAGNFQTCLDLATGSHLVFMGCDDALLPGYVAVVRRSLGLYPHAEAVQPGVEVMDADGETVRPLTDRVKRALAPRTQGVTTLSGERLMTSLMRGNWTYFPAICWRRERIAEIGFRQDLQVTPDLALLARLTLDGGALVIAPEIAFRYRRHAASVSAITARESHRFDEETSLFREIAQACRDHGWPRASRAARAHATSRVHAGMYAAKALVARDRRTCIRLLRNVFAP